MMKKALFFLIPVFLLFFSPVQAQILRSIARSAMNQAKSSAENRAEKEVDKKVDDAVNKSIDKMLESDSTETKKNTKKASENSEDADSIRASKFMKSLGISNDVKHKELYKFTGQITMVNEITDGEGEKLAPIEYVISFNEKNSDANFQFSDQTGKATTMIYDQENKCMLMLSNGDGGKTGFATKIDIDVSQSKSDETDVAEDTEATEVDDCMKKTGKSKTISGYSCNEYRCETNDAITTAWVTKQFSSSNNKLFKNTGSGYGSYNTNGLDGMVVQYETKSKSDKSEMVMTVKSINMNKSSSFSTAGYQISGLAFGSKK
jgi:hypothetical protein